MAESVRARLLAAGLSPEEVDEAERGGTLTLLAFESLLLTGRGRFTVDEAVAAAGIEAARARRLWRAMGFPDPQPGERSFTVDDVTAFGWAAAIDNDETFERVVELTRVMASALTRVAEAWSDLMLPVLLPRELTAADEERAAAILDRFDPGLPHRLIDFVSRRQLVVSLGRHLTGGVAAGRPVAVAFADLVGFTALSQQLSEQDLGRIVGEFEARAHDVVTAGGGRVVKMIGDEVMFVAPDAPMAASIALELAARLGLEGLPPARVGLAWGSALAREGDYFGVAVNVASRLVSVAPPGTVLTTAPTCEALREDVSVACRDAGVFELKDLGAVQLYEIVRA